MTTEELAEMMAGEVRKAIERAAEVLRAEFAERLAALPAPAKGDPGNPGKDVDPESVRAMVMDSVREAVSQLPPAPPGRDADPEVIRDMVNLAVLALPKPTDGKDVDPAVVKSLVEDAVLEAVSALPAPKDGLSVTVEDCAPLIAAEVAKAVPPAPKDGVGIRGAILIDGRLVLEFSDGTQRDVGMVAGKDGKDADPGEVELIVRRLFESLPRPKNGDPGRDGVGTIEEVTRIARETVVSAVPEEVRRQVAEVVKDLPRMEYREVWRPDPEVRYEKGNTVTFGGSLWVCKVSGTPEKPGTGDGWQLAVKKGRDGKDVAR